MHLLLERQGLILFRFENASLVFKPSLAPPCGAVSPDFCENPAGNGAHDHTDHGQNHPVGVDAHIDPFPKLDFLNIK